MRSDLPHSLDPRFEDLLEEWLDGELETALAADLEVRLKEDPAAREALTAVLTCRGLGSWALGSQEAVLSEECQAARALFPGYLRERLTPARRARLSTHLESCVACQGTWRLVQAQAGPGPRLGRRAVAGSLLLVAAGGLTCLMLLQGSAGPSAARDSTAPQAAALVASPSRLPRGWPAFPGNGADRAAILEARQSFEVSEAGTPGGAMLAETERRLGAQFVEDLSACPGARRWLDHLQDSLTSEQVREYALQLYVLQDASNPPRERETAYSTLGLILREDLGEHPLLQPEYRKLLRDPVTDAVQARLLQRIWFWEGRVFEPGFWHEQLDLAWRRQLSASMIAILRHGILARDRRMLDAAQELLEGGGWQLPLVRYRSLAGSFLRLARNEGGEGWIAELERIAGATTRPRARAAILSVLARSSVLKRARKPEWRRDLLAMWADPDPEVRREIARVLIWKSQAADGPVLDRVLAAYAQDDPANARIDEYMIRDLRKARTQLDSER